MTLLGIDYGRKRIGLARSNPLGLAVGAGMLQVQDSWENVLEQLANLVREEQISKIIIGLPKNMDNSLGAMAQEVLQLAARLQEYLQLPVVTWDERLTTRQAERAMLQGRVRRDKRRAKRDEMAAILLLQNYLEVHGNS